jgi:hypothetical protein
MASIDAMGMLVGTMPTLVDFTGPVAPSYRSPFTAGLYVNSLTTGDRYYVMCVDASGVRAIGKDVHTGEVTVLDDYNLGYVAV